MGGGALLGAEQGLPLGMGNLSSGISVLINLELSQAH